MSLRHPIDAAIAALFTALLLVPALSVSAEEELPTDWTLRQFLVPQSELPARTAGTIPIRRSEFEELIQAHRDSQLQPHSRRALPVREATYFARFQDGQLVDGQARLVVEETAARGAFLPLEPCRLAVSGLRWSGGEASVLAGRNQQGAFLVAGEPQASLHFDWSLNAAQRQPRHQFLISVPRSSVNRFLLLLPDGLVPTSTVGIVSQLAAAEAEEMLPFALRETQLDELQMSQLWSIETGSGFAFTLQIAPRAILAGSASYSEHLAYQITEAGIELQAKLSLDVAAALTSLTIVADPQLRFVTARAGEQPLKFHTRSRTTVIEFPQPLLPGQRELDLTAMAPLTLAVRSRLPGFEVVDTRWHHGVLTLDVPDIFELKKITPTGYVETSVEPLPSPQSGEARTFQAFDSQSSLEVVLEHRQPRLDIRTGTTLRMTDTAISARLLSVVSTDRGEQYQLDFQSPREWIVDSFETIPAGDLASYTSAGTPPVRHRIRLREPITPERQLQLVVQAHRRTGTDFLTSGDLRPIVSVSGQEQRYTSLIAEAPFQLSLANDAGLQRIAPELLPPDTRDLVEAPPGSLVYDDSNQLSSFLLKLNDEPPKYSARIEVAATIDGETIHQHYTIHCEPQAGAVARVRVRVAGGDKTPIEWSAESESGTEQISARLVPSDGPPDSETWELGFRTPRLSAFTLHGHRRDRLSAITTIPLASVLEASSQSGSLSIAAADGSAFSIQGRGLRPVSPQRPPGPLPTSRAHYRYNPADSVVLVSRIAQESQPPVVWVWHCRLRSWFDQSGAATHRALLELENLGARQARIQLPHSATIVRATVGGVEIPLPSTVLRRHGVTVPLAVEQRHVQIQLDYTSRLRPLGTVSSIETPWPLFEVPCLQRSWSVWLPPNYRALAGENRIDPRPRASLQWDQRLFGAPILRSNGEPFEAFSVNGLLGWFGSATAPAYLRAASIGQPSGWGEVEPNSTDDLFAGGTGQGWNRYEIDLDPRQKAALRIVRSPFVDATAWSLVLIAAGLGTWVVRRWGSRFLYALSAAAALTLIAPPGLVPVARGVFLGLLLAAGYLLCRRGRQSVEGLSATSQRATATAIGLMVCFLGTPAAAQIGETRRSAEQTANIPVLVPVDDQFRPTGEVVYVPPHLYDFLHQLSAERPMRTSWLLQSARYEISPARRNSTGLGTSRLRATFNARVFRSGRIVLPFRQDQIGYLEARVDGRIVTPHWRNDQLEIEARATGETRVELLLHPLIRQVGARSAMRLAIPAVQDSELIVTAPSGLGGVQVDGCLGAVTETVDGTTTVIRADVGPSRALELQWSDSQPVQADLRVQQLTRLEPQPNSALVDCRYEFSVISGQVDAVRFFADPQLVVQGFGDQAAVATYSVNTTDRHSIEVELDRTYHAGARFSLQAQFLWPGVPGIGRTVLPRVTADVPQPAEEWFVLRLPDSRVVNLPHDGSLLPASSADLPPEWMPGIQPDSLVFRVVQPADEVAISVRPRRLQPMVSQETTVSVGGQFTELRYRAQIDTLGEQAAQQELRVPLEIEVTSITATDSLLRWSRDDSGAVTLFFSEAPNGRFELELQGVVATPQAGELAIPRLELAGGNVAGDTVHLFRQPEVILDSGDLDLQQDSHSTVISGRYVGSLDVEGESRNPVVHVRENNPRVSAEMTMELVSADEAWFLRVGVEAQVEAGIVDQFRLRVPAEWEQPLELSSSARAELVQAGGTGGQISIIRPEKAISDSFRFQVQTELPNPPERDFSLPDIVLLDVASVERFVTLPRTINEQQFAWELSGLDFASSSAASPSSATYRVVGQSIQAILRDIQRAAGEPQLLLADYYLSWNRDRTCCGVAAFDLQPARQATCRLVMPEGLRPVQITVGGLPALDAALGDRRWRVRLGSDQLTQRVEVLFTGRVSDKNLSLGGQTLVAPFLERLPAKTTLWTIRGPSGEGRIWPLLRHTQVDGGSHAKLRLTTIRDILDSAATEAAGTAASEYQVWRDHWLTLAWHQRQKLSAIDPASSELASWLSRLPAATTRDAHTPAALGGFAGKWGRQAAGRPLLHCSVRGSEPEFIVKRRGQVVPPVVMRLGALFLVLALVAAGLQHHRFALGREWLVRWPHGVGVLIGVVIWLASTAGFVGCLLMMLFALSAVRPCWRYVSPAAG